MEETTRPVLPTATGFAAKQAISALLRNNIAVAPVLERAGLTEQDFDRGQRRISAAAQGRFLEYAAQALNDNSFGLNLAKQVSPREAGLLFYVASAARNVEEGLSLFGRYCRIVDEAMRVKLTRAPKGLIAEVNFVGVPAHEARQVTEFGVAVIVKGVREVAGRNIRPSEVAFAHRRNSNRGEFERFFGCPVDFGAPYDRLGFSNETLVLPLITEDRHLLEALQPICEEAERERNSAAGTVRVAVENEAQKLLPYGKAKRETVASKLAMSTRTLSRRLAVEGTTFEEVLDQLRRSLAFQYVKEPGLSLSQIAWLLGYEGSTSFNHAFRRWTGQSPSLARSEQQPPPAQQ